MAYTVVSGDNLNRIAAANGMTLAELLALNKDITNPDLIQIGQKINVSSGDSSSTNSEETSSSGGGSYTVASGDTLGRIAKDNGMTLSELLKLNPDIKDANLIFPGQNINLGGDGGSGDSGDSGGSADTSVDAGGGVTVDSGTPAGEDIANEGVGAGGVDEETQLTILTSNEMEWFFDKTSGKWYVAYGLPNSDRRLIFEADPDQMDSLFGDNMRPTSFKNKTFSTLAAEDKTTFAGNISEMEGTGTFEDQVQKVISIALDNGSLPSWMEGSAAAMDILFISQTENKGFDWMTEQFSKLPEFIKRFPNIEAIKDTGNLTLAEAVTGFLEFEAGLRQGAAALGGSADEITPATVAALTTKGYSLENALDVMKTYDRIEAFGPALEAFNSILVANGLDPMGDEQDVYEFMTGQAPADVYDLYEASSLAEAAGAAGLGDIFTADDAIEAGLSGNHTLATATEAMQKAAQLLLRLRTEVDAGQYGLTQDELIDVSLGQAPTSGRTEVEVFEMVNRATLAAKARLQGRTNPYQSFDDSGRIGSQSLSALRQGS
jgi:LysM repeat protein